MDDKQRGVKGVGSARVRYEAIEGVYHLKYESAIRENVIKALLNLTKGT